MSDSESCDTFEFDHGSGRWCIGVDQLHCGDCFRIRLADAGWLDARIEHTDGKWVLLLFSPTLDNPDRRVTESALSWEGAEVQRYARVV